MEGGSSYDVVIVGGGPAGAAAGCLLGGGGHRVLIIDRATFPRDKVCAGCLTRKTIRLLERIFGTPVEALRDAGAVDCAGTGYRLYLNKDLVLQGSPEEPFYFVRRERYDHLLLKRAEDAGAVVLQGDAVISLDMDKNEVVTASGRRIGSRFVIGADGVGSMVRGHFPPGCFDREEWRRNTAIALEIFIGRDELRLADAENGTPLHLDGQTYTPMVFLGDIFPGYGWLFPNSDRIVVGVCGIPQPGSSSLAETFRAFLSGIGLTAFADRRPVGHRLPYGSFLWTPVYRNLFLTGDAGGFADPLLGEGIFYAHRTAELAAFAVHRELAGSGDAAEIYVALLGRHVYPELDCARRLRDAVLSGLKIPLRFPVAPFVRMIGPHLAEAVHGDRSFRWFRRADGLHQEIRMPPSLPI
ncbi:MAG: geranylgeranyl reductase family protein [Methanomicrobiaceae archaeon]|nr:geranylgeranyl reductase family protein [Methanomicrobiaceae archaeon]MDD5418756.1 geranylgeranyl reductase family protein [Methanomicrobiaceae archaeon]